MPLAEPVIVPTLLCATFEEFKTRREKCIGLVPYAQIDIMDGQFVPTRSFSDIEKINDLGNELPYDLHLMIADPLAEMEKWKKINNVFRAIFPIESAKNVDECIAFARNTGWQVGLVLNPETPLSACEPYFSKIDVLLFMTVHPGYNGAPFVPEVLEKIKEFTKLEKRPLCAVDGSVNLDTAPLLRSAGVEIFNVGSYFSKAPDLKKAYQKIKQSLS